MSFSQLRISSDILKGLKDVKIESPSPLQKKTISATQQGNDLIVLTSDEKRPETGYLVPILDNIARKDRRQGTKAILLTQSPERAAELDKWIWGVGYHAGIESAPIIDADNIEEQKSILSSGPAIIVATPERLADLMDENRIVFRENSFLVLDRSDEISTWDAVERIKKRIIGKCQIVATLQKADDELAERFRLLMNDPKVIEMAPAKTAGNGRAASGRDRREPDRDSAHERRGAGKESGNNRSGPDKDSGRGQRGSGGDSGITRDLTQYYIKVPPRMKISTLLAHLDQTPTDTVLIFTASRRTADRLYRILRKSGRRVVSIHKQLDKKTYNERFQRFTSGNVQHLIAGEFSSSELPIEQVTQVINYDVPEDVGEYKKRAELIGSGKATRIVSLVSKQDRSDIKGIIEELGYAPEEIPLPEGTKNRRDKDRSRNRSRQKSKKKRPPKKKPKKGQKREPVGLPRPSYDKLSGGRSGKKEKKEKGLKGFFKRLFS